jgi:cell division septal protein FtsQ
VLAVLIGGAWLTAKQLAAAQVLTVRRVLIHGHTQLTVAEVEALIGGVRGTSLLAVDLTATRGRLLESPWVADVRLRRVLPDTLDLYVLEREPVAIARLGQTLYLIDDTGVIMDEFGPAYRDFDLPIVDGLAAPRTEDGPPVDAARAQLTGRFLRTLAGYPDLRRALSQVDVSTPGNVKVLLGDDPTWLYLGDENFVERMRTYFELVPTLDERGRVADYVDLRFGSRVFVRDRK